MAGKAINQYSEYTGPASGVNILVQEVSQTDPNTFEHKKANLGDIMGEGITQEITEGDTEHAPSGDAVYQALEGKADQSDLTSEVSERQAETSNLQSQIVNTNAELDNVEAFIGGDAQVENTDPTEGESLLAQSRLIHHANLLPNGKFGRVGARSVAWNQLAQPLTAGYSTYLFSATALADSHRYTGTGSGLGELYKTGYSFTTGHEVIIGIKFLSNSGGKQIRVRRPFISDFFTPVIGWNFVKGTVSANDRDLLGIQFNQVVEGDVFEINDNIILSDLTVMNMASLSANQFRALFPASYYPHDEGHIYDLNPSGFRIRGINLWDEVTELGSINADGTLNPSSTTTRSKNFISLIGNIQYFIQRSTAAMFYVYLYDVNKNFVRSVQRYTDGSNDAKFTTASNEVFMLFYISGTTYNHDIQICYDSLPTSIKTTHHSYEEQTVDTPQIADGHYVNENVYDYVENVVEDGIVKGKHHTIVGTYTFTGEETVGNPDTRANGDKYFTITLTGVNNVKGRTSSRTGAILSDVFGLNKTSASAMYNGSEHGFYYHTGTDAVRVCISASVTTKDECIAWLTANTPTIYFELNAETITDCEPLRSFPISDYSTIEPITPQDELVNRIDVPFSVKSVSANTLIEQITQNTADIAEEKAIRSAQVSALDKRVTNLELKTGDQFDVDYPSDTYGMNGVPSNVEPYAEVKTLRGVGRIANQLFDISETLTGTSNGITNTVSGNVITFSGTASASYLRFLHNTKSISNHTVLLYNAGTLDGYATVIVNGSTQYKTIYAHDGLILGNCESARFYAQASSGKTLSGTTIPILRDLTVYFNGSIPSNAQTIAQIQQNYPELLEPSEYNTGSVVFPTYTGVRAWVRNIWDEEWDNGTIDSSGNNASGSTVRSKNYIPVVPSETYYFLTPIEKVIAIAEYDADKNFIKFVYANGDSKTVENNCFYVRFYVLGTGYTSYANDICINKSDSQNGTYTPWHEPDTLALPEPVTLKGAGSVSEEYYPKTGRITHPISTHNLGSMSYTYVGVYGSATNVFTGFMEGKIVNSSTLANALCEAYIVATNDNLYTHNVACISFADASPYIRFRINDPTFTRQSGESDADFVARFKAHLADKMLYMERATPHADTYVDPLPDNFVEVEPNGTIEAIQSQSPEVDSAMTVEYMAS